MCTRACLRLRLGCTTWNEWRCWLQHISLRTFFSPRLSFCADCQTKIRNNIEKKKIECCGLWVGVQICTNRNSVCDCAYVFVRAHTVYLSPLRHCLKQMTTFHIVRLRVCFGPSACWRVPIAEKSRRFTGKPVLSRQGSLPKNKQKWMVSPEQFKVSVEKMWRRVQFS